MDDPRTWAAVVGCIAGLLAFYDRYRNRRAKLRAFAPYYWHSVDANTQMPILAIYFRFANFSKANGFIYLETSQLELYFGKEWHKTVRLDLDTKKPISTDFPRAKQVAMGLTEAAFLSKFTDGAIAYDKPLCGYLAFSSPDAAVLSGFTKLRYTVRDCHFNMHVFEIDIAKQKKRFDPAYETKKPNKTVDSTATRVTPPASSLRSGQEARHEQP